MLRPMGLHAAHLQDGFRCSYRHSGNHQAAESVPLRRRGPTSMGRSNWNTSVVSVKADGLRRAVRPAMLAWGGTNGEDRAARELERLENSEEDDFPREVGLALLLGATEVWDCFLGEPPLWDDRVLALGGGDMAHGTRAGVG